MLVEVKAPHLYEMHGDKTTLFLSGSIEMGKAERWQERFVAMLKEKGADKLLILNPRRDDWDSSWEPIMSNHQFKTQVEWELTGLEASDIIIVYLAPGTQSPITLLETGMYMKSAPKKMIVCCPEGFWRKGNIDVTGAFYGVQQVETLEEMADEVIRRLKRQAAA